MARSMTTRGVRVGLRGPALVGAVCMMVLAAGCAGDGGGESGGTNEATAENNQTTEEAGRNSNAEALMEAVGYQIAATEEETNEAREVGETAGSEGGARERPPSKKIAFIHFTAQSTSSRRVHAGVESAANELGFELITCDPEADPSRITQCGTAMLAQGPDLILSFLGESAHFGSALEEAKSRDIPWVNLAAPVTSSPDMLQYVTEAELVQTEMNEWLIEELRQRVGDDAAEAAEVLAFGAPAADLSNAIQWNVFLEGMEAASHVDVIERHELDLGNLVQDTVNTTRRTIQQNPSLDAIWTVCDLCVPTLVQGIGDYQGDDPPLLTGNNSTPETADLIREGDVAGVVDLPWEVYGWVALDRALDHWASGEPMSDEPVRDSYRLTFGEPYMLTEDNIGSSEFVPVHGPDFVTFFTTKWRAQYGE